jgi:hypothetical protein
MRPRAKIVTDRFILAAANPGSCNYLALAKLSRAIVHENERRSAVKQIPHPATNRKRCRAKQRPTGRTFQVYNQCQNRSNP